MTGAAPNIQIGPILGLQANFGAFKRTEIIQSIFSNHNGINLEIKSRHKQKGSQQILGN